MPRCCCGCGSPTTCIIGQQICRFPPPFQNANQRATNQASRHSMEAKRIIQQEAQQMRSSLPPGEELQRNTITSLPYRLEPSSQQQDVRQSLQQNGRTTAPMQSIASSPYHQSTLQSNATATTAQSIRPTLHEDSRSTAFNYPYGQQPSLRPQSLQPLQSCQQQPAMQSFATQPTYTIVNAPQQSYTRRSEIPLPVDFIQEQQNNCGCPKKKTYTIKIPSFKQPSNGMECETILVPQNPCSPCNIIVPDPCTSCAPCAPCAPSKKVRTLVFRIPPPETPPASQRASNASRRSAISEENSEDSIEDYRDSRKSGTSSRRQSIQGKDKRLSSKTQAEDTAEGKKRKSDRKSTRKSETASSIYQESRKSQKEDRMSKTGRKSLEEYYSDDESDDQQIVCKRVNENVACCCNAKNVGCNSRIGDNQGDSCHCGQAAKSCECDNFVPCSCGTSNRQSCCCAKEDFQPCTCFQPNRNESRCPRHGPRQEYMDYSRMSAYDINEMQGERRSSTAYRKSLQPSNRNSGRPSITSRDPDLDTRRTNGFRQSLSRPTGYFDQTSMRPYDLCEEDFICPKNKLKEEVCGIEDDDVRCTCREERLKRECGKSKCSCVDKKRALKKLCPDECLDDIIIDCSCMKNAKKEAKKKAAAKKCKCKAKKNCCCAEDSDSDSLCTLVERAKLGCDCVNEGKKEEKKKAAAKNCNCQAKKKECCCAEDHDSDSTCACKDEKTKKKGKKCSCKSKNDSKSKTKKNEECCCDKKKNKVCPHEDSDSDSSYACKYEKTKKERKCCCKYKNDTKSKTNKGKDCCCEEKKKNDNICDCKSKSDLKTKSGMSFFRFRDKKSTSEKSNKKKETECECQQSKNDSHKKSKSTKESCGCKKDSGSFSGQKCEADSSDITYYSAHSLDRTPRNLCAHKSQESNRSLRSECCQENGSNRSGPCSENNDGCEIPKQTCCGDSVSRSDLKCGSSMPDYDCKSTNSKRSTISRRRPKSKSKVCCYFEKQKCLQKCNGQLQKCKDKYTKPEKCGCKSESQNQNKKLCCKLEKEQCLDKCCERLQKCMTDAKCKSPKRSCTNCESQVRKSDQKKPCCQFEKELCLDKCNEQLKKCKAEEKRKSMCAQKRPIPKSKSHEKCCCESKTVNANRSNKEYCCRDEKCSEARSKCKHASDNTSQHCCDSGRMNAGEIGGDEALSLKNEDIILKNKEDLETESQKNSRISNEQNSSQQQTEELKNTILSFTSIGLCIPIDKNMEEQPTEKKNILDQNTYPLFMTYETLMQSERGEFQSRNDNKNDSYHSEENQHKVSKCKKKEKDSYLKKLRRKIKSEKESNVEGRDKDGDKGVSDKTSKAKELKKKSFVCQENLTNDCKIIEYTLSESANITEPNTELNGQTHSYDENLSNSNMEAKTIESSDNAQNLTQKQSKSTNL